MNVATLGVGAATNGEFQDNSHLEARLELRQTALTAVVVNTLQTRGSRQRSPRSANISANF
jgi:hypothetical protein